MTVVSIFFKIILISRRISTLNPLSRFEKGSSINKSFGFLTKDLANDTRCFCPPESSSTYLFKYFSTRSKFIICSTKVSSYLSFLFNPK